MHKEVVMRRADKRRASVGMRQDYYFIPSKKRKLLDLVEYHIQDPHRDINEDHSSPVAAILEYLITMASTLPGEVPGVQDSTIVAHRQYDCPTPSSYSSVTHKVTTASIPSSSISFLFHTQHQTSDRFSPLSHQVTGLSQHISTPSLLSHQVAGLPPPPIISSLSYLTSHHSLDI